MGGYRCQHKLALRPHAHQLRMCMRHECGGKVWKACGCISTAAWCGFGPVTDLPAVLPAALPAGFECDYTRYPGLEAQALFFSHYFAPDGSDEPVQLSAEELKKLSAEANLYALVSHVYWGIWALIQARWVGPLCSACFTANSTCKPVNRCDSHSLPGLYGLSSTLGISQLMW